LTVRDARPRFRQPEDLRLAVVPLCLLTPSVLWAYHSQPFGTEGVPRTPETHMLLLIAASWLVLVPLTLVAVWAAVYRPRSPRDERGGSLPPARGAPRGRHRKGPQALS
jgi:hypothetical protein